MSLRSHLIEDIDCVGRFASTWVSGITAAMFGAFALLPPRFADAIPEKVYFGIGITMAILNFLARIKRQPALETPKCSSPTPLPPSA